MMIRRIQQVLRLSATIFTVCVVLQLVTGHQVNNEMLLGLLICSVGASLVRFLLFRKFLSEAPVAKQLLYMLVVWLLVVAFNFLFQWGMSVSAIFGNAGLVLITYVCVRFISYRHDKTEVREMNKLLEQLRKKDTP